MSRSAVVKNFNVGGHRLKRVRVDPFGNDALELNLVAGDVLHDAGDGRHRGDDVEFLFRLDGGWFLFLPTAGDEKSCEGQNYQPCHCICKLHLKREAFPFVRT